MLKFYTKEFITALRRAINKYPLKERERSILSYRYGLGEDKTMHTYKETAEMFNLTPERIRMINKRAVEKLGINAEDYKVK